MSVENATNKVRDTLSNLNITTAGIGTTTGTATAGSSRVVSGASGGVATTGTAGAGGTLNISAGIGGDATTGTSGAGGAFTFAGGAAGTCSGAGAGGNGGNVILAPGAAGTTVGGTAGLAGIIVLNDTYVTSETETTLADASITLTAAQLRTGFLFVSANAGGFTLTLPSATVILAGFPGTTTGDVIHFYIVQASTGQTVTLAVDIGGTITAHGTLTVATAVAAHFAIRFTAATTADLYRLS